MIIWDRFFSELELELDQAQLPLVPNILKLNFDQNDPRDNKYDILKILNIK